MFTQEIIMNKFVAICLVAIFFVNCATEVSNPDSVGSPKENLVPVKNPAVEQSFADQYISPPSQLRKISTAISISSDLNIQVAQDVYIKIQ
jgi:PBP1b-binding outer membrane lipoprotein LpoB